MIITNGIDIIDIRRIKKLSKNMEINLKKDVLVLMKFKDLKKNFVQLSLMLKDMLQKKHVQKP